MRTTSLFPSVLAIICFAGSTGCGGAPDEDGQENIGTQEEAANSANVGVCFNGMTTAVKKVNQYGNRCNLTQLGDMLAYTCAHDPKVCDFLNYKLAGHATIQCTPYQVGSATKWCADVVDRNPDGSSLEDPKDPQNPPYSRNYFIAYAHDTFYPTHPDVTHWNTLLGDVNMTNPPISLTFAGREDDKTTFHKPGTLQPSLDSRWYRLFKFDPRECGSCGFYNGPNLQYANPVDISTGWFPSFDSSVCTFQQNKGDGPASWMALNQAECDHEYAYRLNGR